MTEHATGWLLGSAWSPDRKLAVSIRWSEASILECASRSWDFRPPLMLADWFCGPPGRRQVFWFPLPWLADIAARPPPAGQGPGVPGSLRRSSSCGCGYFSRLAGAGSAREQVAWLSTFVPLSSIWPVILLKRLGLFRGKVVLSFHGTDVERRCIR